MEYESTKGLVKRAVAQSKIIENKIIGKTGVMHKDLNKAKRTIKKSSLLNQNLHINCHLKS